MSNESERAEQPVPSVHYDQAYFENETPEQKQERTEHWRSLLRQSLDNHLPYFHKHHWAQIAADIRQRIKAAPDEKAKAEAQEELRAHYEKQSYPETSREALLAEIDTRELPPPGL